MNEHESTTDMRQMTALGRSIEENSFAQVEAEAGPHQFSATAWEVVRRVIHATADFEFKTLLELHPQAIASGIKALRAGCNLVVDVAMIEAGLNKERLAAYGCRVAHHISDPDVIAAARTYNSTRAIYAMRKAHAQGLLDGAILAIGNAPTALIEIARLIEQTGLQPALVIGVPVGFVSAAESKELIRTTPCPYIISRGRKGGSPIAVAIVHALLTLASRP